MDSDSVIRFWLGSMDNRDDEAVCSGIDEDSTIIAGVKKKMNCRNSLVCS